MKFIQAVFILSGMIIGAGMFGIPFSFVQAGFWLGAIELFIITAVILFVHLLYGEIVLDTKELHRLPGYVRIYLGPGASRISWASALFGISGTLLAYVILGTVFLYEIVDFFGVRVDENLAALFFVIIGALITFFPLKKEASVNGVLTALLIGFIIFLIVFLFPRAALENLSGFYFQNIFAPYGVLLFALSGAVVIPDLITFLGRDRIRARRAIVTGTLLSASLYFFFVLAVVGALGTQVSEETIRGLGLVLGERFALLGSVMGFLAVFTSYIALNTSFQALLTLDFRMSRILSWIGVAVLPLIFYFSGFRNFLPVIAAVGTIGVGIDSFLIIATYRRMRHDQGFISHRFLSLWQIGLYGMISIGLLYEFLKHI